jgi:hypothetical protein
MPMETQEMRLAPAGELTLAAAQQLRADLLQGLEHGGPVLWIYGA